MRLKGKVVSWNEDKAFGFIKPSAGGNNIFMHKSALYNKNRTPKLNDIITFTAKENPKNKQDKQGRMCATEATFSGEKRGSKSVKQGKSRQTFSIVLALVFLFGITAIYFLSNKFPEKLLFSYLLCFYLGLSLFTFIAYALDKYKAKKGAWRTSENTLHLLALLGGWPGAALAQQLFRHKSSKREFRQIYWLTVIINCGGLAWLFSPYSLQVL